MVRRASAPAIMDLIHAAALSPGGWDKVLRTLASMTGCVAGGLTVERPSTRQGVPLTFFGFDPDIVERLFDRYLPLNPLFGIVPRMQRGFVVSNGDVVAPDVFRQSAFFNGWARPQGLCSPITVVIHRTDAAYVPLTLVRPDGAGEATPRDRALLNRLAPHLVHAMDVTIRLQRSEGASHGSATMLEALPCAAILLDRARRIVFANAAAEEMLGAEDGVLTWSSRMIGLRDPATDHRFQAVVSAALGAGTPPSAGHLSVQHPAGDKRLAITVTPLPARDAAWGSLAEDAGGQARCLVLVGTQSVTRLARHYGLTPAEARVVAAVCVGKGLTAAARTLGIARSTAQSHLDKVFQKTGTSRQAELVGLAQAGLGP